MESVYLFTLGRCLLKRYRIVWAKRLDDIKGGTLSTYFFYMDCDLCSALFPP